jgi:hypothetical protein
MVGFISRLLLLLLAASMLLPAATWGYDAQAQPSSAYDNPLDCICAYDTASVFSPIDSSSPETGLTVSIFQYTGLVAPNSGLSVVSRPGMASRVVTAPNGQSLTISGQAEMAASTTPGHAEAMNNLVACLAETGEYECVTLQRSWRTPQARG